MSTANERVLNHKTYFRHFVCVCVCVCVSNPGKIYRRLEVWQ